MKNSFDDNLQETKENIVDFMYESYIHLKKLFDDVNFINRVEENGLDKYGDSIELDLFLSTEEEKRVRIAKEQLIDDVFEYEEHWKYKVILPVSLLDESHMKYSSIVREIEENRQNEILSKFLEKG